MQEREVVVLELDYLSQKARDLREGLEREQAGKRVDLGRWGSFSHEWNKSLRAWREENKDCVIRSTRHRKAHRLAILLFAAWQEIHYTLTRPRLFRGTIVNTSTLEGIERTLEVEAEEGQGEHE